VKNRRRATVGQPRTRQRAVANNAWNDATRTGMTGEMRVYASGMTHDARSRRQRATARATRAANLGGDAHARGA